MIVHGASVYFPMCPFSPPLPRCNCCPRFIYPTDAFIKHMAHYQFYPCIVFTVLSHRFFIGYFVLNISPYRMISQGAGIMAAAINPSKLFPHPIPSSWYISSPHRGSTAPKMLLITVLAASADAA